MPAHQARMQQRVQVREEAFPSLARLPGIVGRLDGHIDEHGRAQDVGFGHEAPVTAVKGIVAIIAQDKVAARGHGDRAVVIGRVGRAVAIGLGQRRAVDHKRLPGGFPRRSPGMPISRLMKSCVRARNRRAKNDHLLTARLAPEAQMVVREGHAGVVAEAAHEQMIADEQRLLHGTRGNHAGLHHRAGDQQERQRHPAPGAQFAENTLAGGRSLIRRAAQRLPRPRQAGVSAVSALMTGGLGLDGPRLVEHSLGRGFGRRAGARFHFELHGIGRVDAGVAGGAEAAGRIVHGAAQAFEGKIANRIGAQEQANLFERALGRRQLRRNLVRQARADCATPRKPATPRAWACQCRSSRAKPSAGS